jgi:hypothetical protein
MLSFTWLSLPLKRRKEAHLKKTGKMAENVEGAKIKKPVNH